MASIVIVDDRITNRNIFAKLSASIEEGISVKAFGEPAEALAWLAKNPCELVITDFKMPQMDGAEFIRRLRLLPAGRDVNTPVVVLGKTPGVLLLTTIDTVQLPLPGIVRPVILIRPVWLAL